MGARASCPFWEQTGFGRPLDRRWDVGVWLNDRLNEIGPLRQRCRAATSPIEGEEFKHPALFFSSPFMGEVPTEREAEGA